MRATGSDDRNAKERTAARLSACAHASHTLKSQTLAPRVFVTHGVLFCAYRAASEHIT